MISNYWKNKIKNLEKTTKQQRYNARRSAKRAGYSNELVNEYLPVLKSFPKIETFNNNEEAKAYARLLSKNLKSKKYGYKGTDLNLINKELKTTVQELKVGEKNIKEKSLEFIEKYAWAQDIDKSKLDKKSDTLEGAYDLPYPGYKNPEKFKKQVSKMREMNPRDRLANQYREDVIGAIDDVLKRYFSDVLELQEKTDLKSKRKLSTIEMQANQLEVLREIVKILSNEDLTVLSRILTHEELIGLKYSDERLLYINKSAFNKITAYFKHVQQAYNAEFIERKNGSFEIKMVKDVKN